MFIPFGGALNCFKMTQKRLIWLPPGTRRGCSGPPQEIQQTCRTYQICSLLGPPKPISKSQCFRASKRSVVLGPEVIRLLASRKVWNLLFMLFSYICFKRFQKQRNHVQNLKFIIISAVVFSCWISLILKKFPSEAVLFKTQQRDTLGWLVRRRPWMILDRGVKPEIHGLVDSLVKELRRQ